jgi:hypothetical protein
MSGRVRNPNEQPVKVTLGWRFSDPSGAHWDFAFARLPRVAPHETQDFRVSFSRFACAGTHNFSRFIMATEVVP